MLCTGEPKKVIALRLAVANVIANSRDALARGLNSDERLGLIDHSADDDLLLAPRTVSAAMGRPKTA
ncbi:MAG: hypothetical protein AAGJ32_01680 [Pseudomonadota bacterium]